MLTATMTKQARTISICEICHSINFLVQSCGRNNALPTKLKMRRHTERARAESQLVELLSSRARRFSHQSSRNRMHILYPIHQSSWLSI